MNKLEDSLNEEITESIIELELFESEREEQTINHPLTVVKRMICDFYEHHQIDYGHNCGRSSGY